MNQYIYLIFLLFASPPLMSMQNEEIEGYQKDSIWVNLTNKKSDTSDNDTVVDIESGSPAQPSPQGSRSSACNHLKTWSMVTIHVTATTIGFISLALSTNALMNSQQDPFIVLAVPVSVLLQICSTNRLLKIFSKRRKEIENRTS